MSVAYQYIHCIDAIAKVEKKPKNKKPTLDFYH